MSEKLTPHNPETQHYPVKRRHIHAVEKLKSSKKDKRNKFHEKQRERILKDKLLNTYLRSLSVDLHFHGANRRRFMQGAREMYGILSNQYGALPSVTIDTKAEAFKRKGVGDLLDPNRYNEENPALMEWVLKEDGHRIVGLNSRGAGRMAVYSLERCNIPNPPIELQRNIASKVS